MFNNTILLLIILISSILIYYLIFQQENHIKKKNKHSRPKKIYISPNITYNDKSIKLMTNKLINKLDKYNKYNIKLYYADWCPHCIDFKPIWNKLKSNYNNINFIDVDCTNKQPNLSFINGFPTIALFDSNNKHIENYENDRTFKLLKQYLDKLNI